MQQSNAPSKLLIPFANGGGKNAIPTASQIAITPGAASLTDGFPPLTRTPIAAGGVPPSGLDMNGILYAISAIARWANAGGGFTYDDAFANDANVDGYPQGARVLRSDGKGYWLNTVDKNKVDPESVTAGQAAAAGWVPDLANGVASVAMTNANVTLSPLQYGLPVIVITGALTANLNLIFPAIEGEWAVLNNTTGNFTITAKTAAGTGVTVNQGGSELLFGDGTNIFKLNPAPPLRIATFTNTGTWTCPPGVTKVYITGVGGGGGGAAGFNATTGGGGGGAGGHCVDAPLNVTPGQTYAITIGAKGIGTGGVDGTAGGATSFGALLTLSGGAGGKVAGGGGAGGGTSGVVGVGAQGQDGYPYNPYGSTQGGNGGSSLFGAGGMGGANGRSASNSTGWGGGGGAAASDGGGGGNGGQGFLIIKY